MAKLRILVADDSQYMRAAYKKILETQDNFEVVAIASDGEEALQKAIELVPDVAILDVRMPKMHGLEAARRIREHKPGTAIVIISAYDDLALVRELVRGSSTAKAYLLKTSLSDIGELIRVVESAADGQLLLDPSIVHKITTIYSGQPNSVLSSLTRGELSVLELMAQGYDDAFIAQTLRIEKPVVVSRASAIYGKLGLDRPGISDKRHMAVLALVNQTP